MFATVTRCSAALQPAAVHIVVLYGKVPSAMNGTAVRQYMQCALLQHKCEQSTTNNEQTQWENKNIYVITVLI